MLAFPLPMDNHRDLRVLCLGSHADDIEIGCGGTILKLAASANRLCVHWVVFGTGGEREAEAKESAGRFLAGVEHTSVITHHFRDGFFPCEGARIKQEFEAIKQRISPDIIFTHALADRHQDHRLIADLTWNTFRDHLILEYEIPKYDGDLGSPNVFVHIDSETAGRKVRELLESFPSQHDKHWFTEDTFLSLMRIRGMESAARHKYAEAFTCRKLLLGL